MDLIPLCDGFISLVGSGREMDTPWAKLCAESFCPTQLVMAMKKGHSNYSMLSGFRFSTAAILTLAIFILSFQGEQIFYFLYLLEKGLVLILPGMLGIPCKKWIVSL